MSVKTKQYLFRTLFPRNSSSNQGTSNQNIQVEGDLKDQHVRALCPVFTVAQAPQLHHGLSATAVQLQYSIYQQNLPVSIQYTCTTSVTLIYTSHTLHCTSRNKSNICHPRYFTFSEGILYRTILFTTHHSSHRILDGLMLHKIYG